MIRRATGRDADRIAEIVAGKPGREAVAIAGCEEAAREFGMALIQLPGSPQGWEHSAVAELGGRIVGVVQTGEGLSLRVTWPVVRLVLRTFGLRILSVWPRHQARQRVEPDVAEGSWYVSELHVDPAYQNRGIGGALLDYAEREARSNGLASMSLQTTTDNPARRLYERHGFRVVKTKTDAVYERITGIAGRHLMVKELA